MNVLTLVAELATQLKTVEDVAAIVLGGSYATNAQRPDSDVDLALYYRKAKPFDIARIRNIAATLNDFPNPVVTDFGQWGKWVNGGAWLTIQQQRVDFLYRNVDFVSKIIDECIAGEMQSDFYQQPPYGFRSYIYCAEIQVCKPLYDPFGLIAQLKSQVATYPPALKKKIVNACLWGAEFSLEHARKFAAHAQVYLFAGCLTRIVSDCVQVLYALNETYYIGDKKFYADVERFSIKPTNLMNRMNEILSQIGNTPEELRATFLKTETLFGEIARLSRERYAPSF